MPILRPASALKLGTTAERIHNYMKFRASRERIAYDLTPEFYQTAIDDGCVSFFGVETEAGILLADEQQPDLFQEWLANGR